MADTAILWHAGCPDGWTAAWVAHRALKARAGIDADLIPVNHGQDPPDLDGYVNVYVVDFSYPHETLVEMAEGRSLIVLDHHRTAIDDIAAARAPHLTESGPVDTLTLTDRPYAADLDINRSGGGDRVGLLPRRGSRVRRWSTTWRTGTCGGTVSATPERSAPTSIPRNSGRSKRGTR